MPQPTPPRPDPEYDALEAALSGTARGRAFLAEHLRRHRAAETLALLEALERLERAVAPRAGAEDALRRELAEARQAAEAARSALALAERERAEAARALRAIGDASESLGEMAWTMRESGFDPRLCDGLEKRVAEISAASEEAERSLGRAAAPSRDEDAAGKAAAEAEREERRRLALARFDALGIRERLGLLT